MDLIRASLIHLALLAMLVCAVAKAQQSSDAIVKPGPMDPAVMPGYDVATIKPSKPEDQGRGFNLVGRHLIIRNMTVQDLITLAYNLHTKQLTGGPDRITHDHFDIDMLPDHDGQPSIAQARNVVRKLLAERFALKTHEDTREMPAYVLSVAKTGSKLTKSPEDPHNPPGLGGPPGSCRVRNGSMPEFAQVMQGIMDRPVIDQTGLKERYDFMLKWTPDESQYGGRVLPQNTADSGANGEVLPTLFTAIQEQLGLKLEPKKAPVKMMVIDGIEKPSEN